MREFFIGSAVLFGLSACTQTNPSTVLAKYGYLQQVPPVAAHGPGNLVWRRTIPQSQERFASLGYICDPEYVTFPSEPIKSATESTDISRELSTKFELSGAELADFGLGTSAGAVNKVSLVFENVEVQQYPLETLETIKASLGPKCKSVLRKQISKQNAFQVVSVVKADVSYVVDFEGDASLAVREQALTAILAKLGTSYSRSLGQEGKGLYYGVSLEPQPTL